VCAGIGSGFRRKGFDLLLDLWRTAVPANAVLLLVGDDERLAAWRRAAAHAPFAGRVVIAGRRDDVDAVLAAADVLCVPSRQEAFGNVILEACAAGVPVVTSRRVGAAELLDGSLAALVVESPEDRPALAAALEHALLGPDRSAFAAAARARAEALPWSAHLDRVEAVLAEVADDR
jgi:glycosyltransferase involved in cell wall biosynthesis